MNITPKMQDFILHFGEMGSRWGINRTVGQIYALLILAKEPLHADEIVEALKVSRSNVSMGLKELNAWNLIKTKHKQGDRKEYFSTLEDPVEIAITLLEERRKREIDPTLSFLRDALLVEPESNEEEYAQERMQEIHDLIESVTNWSTEIQNLSTENLYRLMSLGSGVGKVLNLKDKLFGK